MFPLQVGLGHSKELGSLEYRPAAPTLHVSLPPGVDIFCPELGILTSRLHNSAIFKMVTNIKCELI